MHVRKQLDLKFSCLSSEIKDWKNSMKMAENELSDQYQSINSKLSSHLERKFMYETQINSLKLKINSIMDELEHISVSKDEIEHIGKELEKDELDMEGFKSSFKMHELEYKLRSLSADLQSKEFLVTEINKEISSLSKHADTRARLGIKMADRESKRTSIESLKAILDSTWKKLDGTKKIKMEAASIESEVRNELR
jgi:chromosome segregation ATPase